MHRDYIRFARVEKEFAGNEMYSPEMLRRLLFGMSHNKTDFDDRFKAMRLAEKAGIRPRRLPTRHTRANFFSLEDIGQICEYARVHGVIEDYREKNIPAILKGISGRLEFTL